MLSNSTNPKFIQVVEHLHQDLKGIKTGRAKPALVEDITAEAYGTRMKISQLASILAPDPHQIVISPWDKSVIAAIAKGVNSAGVNLNAVVDGEVVRIAIPPLTAETREQLAKLVHQKVESAKVMLRQVRAEAKREIENRKEAGGVSEDQIRREMDQLQESVNHYEEQLEQIGKAKETELRNF